MIFRGLSCVVSLWLVCFAVAGSPGGWEFVRRGEAGMGARHLRLRGKIAYLRGLRLTSLALRFSARALGHRPEIWVRVAYRDDHDNLAIALRGAPCDDVLVFRFRLAGDRLIGLKPLPFKLQAGRWYDISVRVDAGRLSVCASGQAVFEGAVPSDCGPGTVAFGGGTCWLEVKDIKVAPLEGGGCVRGQFSPRALRLNFGPAGIRLPTGWKNADAGAYDPARSYGWLTPPTGTRRRNKVPDILRDTLIPVAHGTGAATFRLDIPDGQYLLTVCGGDPAFPARLEWWIDDEKHPWVAENLPAGDFQVHCRPLTVSGGHFTLRVVSHHPDGQPGGVVNWLVVERRADVSPRRWRAAMRRWLAEAEAMRREYQSRLRRQKARRAMRRLQRHRWRGPKLPEARGPRVEVSLGHRWLFLPEHERRLGEQPWTCRSDDRHWHVIDVPAFWQPTRWWIFGSGSGVSDNWRKLEQQRCDDYTFDWRRTSAAWYRQRFYAPGSYRGRRVVLRFEGVARACQVWLNGKNLGAHFGMFGPWEVDISDALHAGAENILTLLVAREPVRPAHDDLGAAVDSRLLGDLVARVPHGMYGAQGGIWGPVSLIATGRPYIADVFFRPRLDGATVQVKVGGLSGSSGAAVRWRLETLDGRRVASGMVAAATTAKTTAQMSGLHVEPWWPERPRLYRLVMEIVAGGTITDRRQLTVGFRTIEVRGNRIYLNGRPYWLRGADHAPSGLRPWSKELAQRFLRLMHDGHQMVTRTHGSPFTECWLDAADRQGVAVSMEGIWPWALHTDSPLPPADVLDVWRDDWLAVMRAARNHPSIIMWTVNNEMYFYYDRDSDRRMKKWAVVSDLIRAMRRLDPTRPVVMDSGYVRREQDVQGAVRRGYDDGDIDDMHRYYGWYSRGPMWLFGRQMEQAFRGDRPAISQEFSTGYPNVDTGHPTRMYIDRNQVAQAWVGDWAYEDHDPAVFLRRQAWLTKELAELGRREARKLCGLLHFAVCTWVQNCYDPDTMKPFLTYYALKQALQPVLVSWESKRRSFYEGAVIGGRVWVVNDDVLGGDLSEVEVTARLRAGRRLLAAATLQLGRVAYYGRASAALRLPVPRHLPAERCDATVELEARAAGRLVSTNRYGVILARRSWARPPLQPAGVEALDRQRAGGQVVVVDGADVADELAGRRSEVLQWVREGGRLVMLSPGAAACRLLPEVLADYVAQRTETVNLWREDSPVFDGLGPLDVAWLAAPGGSVCGADGFYRLRSYLGQSQTLPADVLATTMRAHGYLAGPQDIIRRKLWGACLIAVGLGRGRVVVCSINVSDRAEDPVAGRLYRNILNLAAEARP